MVVQLFKFIVPNPWFGLIFLTAAVSWPVMGLAETLPLGPGLKANGWNTYTPRGKTPAQFSIGDDGALRIEAEQAVAFLYREVPKDGAQATSLSWLWRVDEDFPPTDLSQPGADDRPLAVHVFFLDQDAGLLKRLTGSFGRFLQLPVYGRAITYVWGGSYEPGAMVANPFMPEGDGVLVIGQASLTEHDDWVRQTVNIAADFEAAFGTTPSRILGIAISSDTDDTGAVSVSRIRDITFIP